MSFKRSMIALMAVAGLAVAGGSGALATGQASEAAKFDIDRQPLSSREIQVWLERAGNTEQLPDNCWKQYSPITGECIAVVCLVGGQLVLLPDGCDAG